MGDLPLVCVTVPQKENGVQVIAGQIRSEPSAARELVFVSELQSPRLSLFLEYV